MMYNTEYRRMPGGRTGSYVSKGGWAQLVAVNAIGPDGKVHKVRVRQSPDTMFSISGRTRIAGVNIAGVVMQAGNFIWVPESDPRAVGKGRPIAGKVLIDNPNAGEYIFTPYATAKHYTRLMERLHPGWPDCEFAEVI
jgi:hypothetical protein